MISVLLFAGISLGLVCLVTADCQAHHHTPDAKDPSKDRAPGD